MSAGRRGAALSEAERRLMDRLLAERGIAPPARPALRREPEPDAPPPLSSAQLRLWFLHCYDPASTAFNVPCAVELCGRLDRGALAAAWNAVVRRHEVLRSRFPSHRGEPRLEVAPPAPVPLPLVDLGALPDGRRREAERLAAAEARRPFDLERGPLLRLRLVRLAGDEHRLLWTVHHIVFDGWSRPILVGELVALYRAAVAGEPSPLPELPVQYADFARMQQRWLAGDGPRRQLDFWRRTLSGLRDLDLPADRPRPERPRFRGATFTFDFDERLAAPLHELARREETTPFIVLLAVFKLLLFTESGETDLAVGTDAAGRDHLQTEALVGFFINQLVLRTDLGGDPTFRALVGRVRHTAGQAFAHQDLPFDRLVQELAPERQEGRLPLFQVKLIYQPSRGGVTSLPGLRLRMLPVDSGSAQLDLTLSIHDGPEVFGGWVNYSVERFERRSVEALLWRFEVLLGLALERPEARLGELAEGLDQEVRRRAARRAERRAAANRDKWARRRVRPVTELGGAGR